MVGKYITFKTGKFAQRPTQVGLVERRGTLVLEYIIGRLTSKGRRGLRTALYFYTFPVPVSRLEYCCIQDTSSPNFWSTTLSMADNGASNGRDNREVGLIIPASILRFPFTQDFFCFVVTVAKRFKCFLQYRKLELFVPLSLLALRAWECSLCSLSLISVEHRCW